MAGPHNPEALCLLGGLLAAGILSLASWSLLGGSPVRPPRTFELVIPPGTAARIEAGEPAPAIPSNLSLVVGDTLVLRNEDSAAQQMGPFAVPSTSTLEIPLSQAGSQTYLCTFHPQSAVGLVVSSRPSPLWMLWTTLLLGLPLGGGAAGLVWLLGRLNLEEEEA